MTQNEYLSELKKELKKQNISDIEDIISEYDEHFKFKINEGLTEEEIAINLPKPKEIANEYAEIKTPTNKSEKVAKTIGITFLSIPVTLAYILLFASVIVLGAFSVACVLIGFCLITTINIASLIPYIPYLSSLILGISFLCLAVLSFIETFYAFKYIVQWSKIYIKWCNNVTHNNHSLLPTMHPQISKKLSFILKLISIIALIGFVVTFALGYGTMCLSAKSFEPWHVWNWFK